MEQATQTQRKITYEDVAKTILHLNNTYGDMPIDAFASAFGAAGGFGMWQYPTIQNQRVKGINSSIRNYTKEQIANMVENPAEHELTLRQVSAALATSAKTYDLIMQTYQDMMTYKWYIYPTYSAEMPDIATQKRDYSLAYKLAKKVSPSHKGHEILGLCMQYGKVFFTPRISVDKSHNKVNYAFLQQLPEDFCKIVGFNDGAGKYTVAFNMMYFMQPGTDFRQFGNLFIPYIDAFQSVVTDNKYQYMSGNGIDVDKFERYKISATTGNPQWQRIGRDWMYWVTLPADKVITFEINDRNAYVIPPNTGLMVSMTQIPSYEAAQMEIVLNPLTSVMTGTLETYDVKNVPNADPIAVSPPVRKIFENLWYEMLGRNNTSGIGLFLAPAKDLRLQTISDTVANTNIATTAVSDQIQKAGLAAIIPTSGEPKVGMAELSAKINAQYGQTIYRTFERFFDEVFESLNLKTPLGFKMFGDVFSHEADLKSAKDGMTLGLLTETLRYDALIGHSILDDMAISDFIDKSGILNKRIPLISTYSAKQSESGLPPQAGRPQEDGSQNAEKTGNIV